MSIADKLTIIADNMPKVYEAGKEAERQTFWYDFQEGGKRTAYNNAFQNVWTDAMLNPIYDIRPTSAGYMFSGAKIVDLKGCLEKSGIVFDTSNATSLDYAFSGAGSLVYCPEISALKSASLWSIFYDCKKLIIIDKLILKSDGSQTFNDNSFKNCSSLVEIRIEGVIGNNVNFQWSKNLSMMSLASIVGALSTSVSGKTITLPNTARATYDNATISGAWDAFIEPYRAYWSFAYA